ncbi:MAG TPA: SusC/RagA family TonB-linked outer membrane protein [Chitinophaga sp.]|uniref:SusC/RagA family TonB-linked outer membrane protein n=1 Tax=Chitinophaga sp. TaxID=1869181 RepID=UPI002C1D9FD2|nr:SusC/RagA family TonB-linked outer membrane protein [Chitinophaga sp.]HVI46104.1 SusC/RagA family TonB-linked outer membrane protein [Chitinophaga sp.]
MKLTFPLLTIALLQISAKGLTQTVTYTGRNVTLKTVLAAIKNQTGYAFFYDKADIARMKPVTVGLKNTSLKDALEEIFRDQPLSFAIEGKTIVVMAKPASASVVAPLAEIHGRILNEKGEPLPGVSVQVKGTNKGTVTNANGEYSLSAKKGDVLIFSILGYQVKYVTVGDNNDVSVSMAQSSTEISEVVVTALGIQRNRKSLSYSTQSVSNAEITRVKDPNPFNSLTGKVAGLQINRSSSGVGGSVRITIRGNKSTRNNQPLYVIDGAPVTNTEGSGSEDAFGGAVDRGDVLSTINPDDIESINVLKGASASALYGSQGSNGVVLITTKKGKAGNTRIDISSDFTIDRAAYKPDLQYTYGQSSDGAMESWGAKGNFADPVKDFFKTGRTWINSVSLSGGNEKIQNYFSYSNTDNHGILPTTTFKQHTLTYRQTSKFFDNKLSLDGNIMYSNQSIHNRPAGGIYYNALTGLYLFPRGLDFNKYKTFEYMSPKRNMMMQDWWNLNYDAEMKGQDNQQNPYWILNRNPNDQKRQNLITSLTLAYPVTDWLKVQARGTLNKLWDKFNRNSYAGTQSTLSGDNGRYQREELEGTALYGDLLFIGDTKLSNDLGLNFTVGGSINDFKQNGWVLDAKNLVVPNVFQLGNLSQTVPVSNLEENAQRWQRQSVFATTNLGYKEKLFLDLTARNDWSSTLAFTPSSGKGYFYWSAGLSAVISDMIKMPAAINYGKVRVSYAEVGNDIKNFSTYPLNKLANGNLTAPTSGPLRGALKPELNRSYEVGTEWRFLDNRLNFDFTWYKSNVLNQYVEIDVPLGFLTSKAYLNAGNIQNKGMEISLGYDVIRSRNFSWNTALNYTHNKNTVLELAPGLSDVYKGLGGSYYVLRLGGSFGDLWGKTFLRDDAGNMVVDAATGRPQGGSDGYLGNTNPDFMLGWNNTIKIKNLTIGLLVDGRFGGQVISLTQGYLNSFGVSRESADARDAGGINVTASKTGGGAWSGKIPAQAYYQGIGDRGGIDEAFVYSATNIRLRELSLSYALPFNLKKVRDIRIGLIGRNLFFIKRDAPYDPELSMSTGTNKAEGFDVFGLPAVRSYGLSLKCSF